MSSIRLKKTPSENIPTPNTDRISMFVDDNGKLQGKNDDGSVTELGGGGNSGNVNAMLHVNNEVLDLTLEVNKDINVIYFGYPTLTK